MVCVRQVDRRLRSPLLALLLLQAVEHDRAAADGRVLRLHRPHVLRLLPHARRRLILLIAQVHPLHLRQHQDGLTRGGGRHRGRRRRGRRGRGGRRRRGDNGAMSGGDRCECVWGVGSSTMVIEG